MPSSHDLQDIKSKEVELSMKNLLKGHNEDHIKLGKEIEKLYSATEMSIVIASLLLKKQLDSSELKLTPEQAAVKEKTHRDRKRSDNKSRRFSDNKKFSGNKGGGNGNGNKKRYDANRI